MRIFAREFRNTHNFPCCVSAFQACMTQELWIRSCVHDTLDFMTVMRLSIDRRPLPPYGPQGMTSPTPLRFHNTALHVQEFLGWNCLRVLHDGRLLTESLHDCAPLIRVGFERPRRCALLDSCIVRVSVCEFMCVCVYVCRYGDTRTQMGTYIHRFR